MYDIYTVKDNDTLESIAKENNMSVNELSILNNNKSFVTIGETLLIPKNTNMYFNFYKITKGDTLYNISKKFNVNASIISQLNGLDNEDYIYPDQIIMIPKKGTRIYITAEGDTLMEIINGINADVNKFLFQNNRLYLMPEQLIVYREEEN